MGMFINVIVDLNKCQDIKEVENWVKVCPVNIFEIKDKTPVVIEENEDECTFCELCLNACASNAITIEKKY